MRWVGFFFFPPPSLAFAQSSYYWPRPQQINGVGEGGVNGGVCTARAVSPPLAPGPAGRGEPRADPVPRSSPRGRRDVIPGKDPSGEAQVGGFAPALLLPSLPRAPLAEPIGAP